MPADDRVEPQDASRRNSPFGEEGQEQQSSGEDTFCYWNDKKYSDGATVCDAGIRYKCWRGRWVDIGNC